MFAGSEKRLLLMIRVREPEIMDSPELSADEHFAALDGLANINYWTRSADILWQPIYKLCQQQGLRSLKVLDIATGGGDVAIALWHKAKNADINFEISACDISPQALQYAQRQAQESNAALEFLPIDVLQESLPGQFDIITSSLFMHHLDPEHIIPLLRKLARACRKLLLVSDLYRSPLNKVMVTLGTHLLSTSPVVRSDAVTSIKAAYTPLEIKDLALTAGLQQVEVEPRFPARWLLSWKGSNYNA